MKRQINWPIVITFIISVLVILWMTFFYKPGIAAGDEIMPLTIDITKSAIVGAEFLPEGYKVEFNVSAMDGITTLKLSIHYYLTLLGGQPRGEQTISLGDIHSAEEVLTWQVPWLDTLTFSLKAKGYNAAGQQVAMIERKMSFVPAAIITAAERLEKEKGKDTFGEQAVIFDRAHQRLYFLHDSVSQFVFLDSTGKYNLNKDKYGNTPPGVYKVKLTWVNRWSKDYQCWMPFGFKFTGKFNCHATSKKYYPLLGTMASHGCVRLHLVDAKKLYRYIRVGDLVIVI